MSIEFKPDWCIAPAATLREWLDENGLSPRVAVAGGVPRHRRDEAAAMIDRHGVVKGRGMRRGRRPKENP